MNAYEFDLIDKIYTAGLIPELWPDVIDRLSGRMGARGGSLFVLSDGHLAWDAPAATKGIMEAYIAGGWDKKNPRLSGLLRRAHPGFIQDDHVVDGSFGELPIVRDFLRPNDIAFTAATVVKGASDDVAVFSIDRGMAAGHFTAAEIAWLDSMRPHLGRSIALTSRLRMQQAATATAVLQTVGVPAAVIGRNLSVIATNPLFDALVGPVFAAAARGRLAVRDRRADKALQQALQQALSQGGDAARMVRSIPVVTASGPVGVLHAIPACRQANDILGTGSTLVVLTQVSDDAASIDADWLKWLYDLSPAEAQVAAQLTRGLSVDEIANKNGNSVATARTHVKHILRKTGSNRQADFLRSVGSLGTLRPCLQGVGGPAATD